MTAELHQIAEVAARSLGPCVPVDELSWPHGEALVVELETATGERVIGKAHRQTAKFTAEHTAYQRWVPSLGRRAPQLIVADPVNQVLIVTKLEASSLAMGPGLDAFDAHRQAGVLLARFHGSEPAVRLRGFAQMQYERFAKWVERADPNVLDDDDVSFVEHQLAVLDDLPDPLGVPCHRDWQPRNWMIDNDGNLHAIDFEHARFGPWYEDVQRLWWNEWMDVPGLAAVFFAGYGRTLDDDEERSFTATSMLWHLSTIVWAHEHGDEAFGAHSRHCLAAGKRHPGNRS